MKSTNSLGGGAKRVLEEGSNIVVKTGKFLCNKTYVSFDRDKLLQSVKPEIIQDALKENPLECQEWTGKYLSV